MKWDKLNLFLVDFILITVVIGITCYCSVGTYSNDEWWMIPYSHCKNFLQNILYSDQGLVWSYNYQKFLIDTSFLFHVHPQQNMYIQMAKALDYAIFIFILSVFCKPPEKKIPHWSVVLINTFLIFSIVIFVNISQIIQINQHFKYIFNLILGFAIWYILINEFFNDYLFSKKNIIRDCLFAIILAFSGHLVNIPTITLFTLLLIYNAIKSKNIFQYFKTFLSTYYPVIIVYFVSFITYLNLPGFTSIRNTRVPSESVISYSFKHFFEFTQEFLGHVFSSQYIYGLLIILLFGIALLFLNRKKIDEKYLVLTISVFIANLSFQYALLTCGRTYYSNIDYWFISPEITVTFLFYIVLDCNIVYGCLFKLLDNRLLKNFSVLFLLIVINLIYPISISYKDFKIAYEKQIIQREAIYKLNKLYRYYNLTKSPILYPADYHANINIFGAVYFLSPSLITKNLSVIYYIEKKESKIINKKILNEDELFSKDELKHINFNKLYDDKFILKMKKPKFIDKKK